MITLEDYRDLDWPIDFQETWFYLDNSKVNDYITCPMLFYLRHVLGLTYENHHLKFGKAWHAAMEVAELSQNFRSDDSKHITLEQAQQAFLNALKKERYTSKDIYDKEVYPKNIFRALQAIKFYWAEYSIADPSEYELLSIKDEITGKKVPVIELRGLVPIHDDQFVFTFDSLLRHKNTDTVIIRDHKTGSSAFRWESSLHHSMQAMAYHFAAYNILPTEYSFNGIQFNATFFKKNKRIDYTKELTDPAHGRNQFDYRRYIVTFLPNDLTDFTRVMYTTMQQIRTDMEEWRLHEGKHVIWKKHFQNCVKFNRPQTDVQAPEIFNCPLQSECSAFRSNTVSLMDIEDPDLFYRKYWNPGEGLDGDSTYITVNSLTGEHKACL